MMGNEEKIPRKLTGKKRERKEKKRRGSFV